MGRRCTGDVFTMVVLLGDNALPEQLMLLLHCPRPD
jgi:hypothetical protein